MAAADPAINGIALSWCTGILLPLAGIAVSTLVGGCIGYFSSRRMALVERDAQVRDRLMIEYQQLDAAVTLCSEAVEAFYYGRAQVSDAAIHQAETAFISNARKATYSLLFLQHYLGGHALGFAAKVKRYLHLLAAIIIQREAYSMERGAEMLEKKRAVFDMLEPFYQDVVCSYPRCRSLAPADRPTSPSQVLAALPQ